jgi:predicted SprT family Zn-dependent metalloprotease
MKNGEDLELRAENKVVKTEQGSVTLRPWKKPLSDFDAALTASAFLKKLVTEGDYDEEEDIILCPQEKTQNTAFGTNEFNRIIAQALGDKRGADIFEVIAGYAKHYLAVGDRLLVGREDAIITAITKNSKYWGKRPKLHSKDLDRWGNYRAKVQETGEDFDVDKYLDSFSLEHTTEEDRKQEASHEIKVQLLDSGLEETISTAGEINATQFAYALTVHKSQGSEWRRVFFLTHQSHVVMWNRELLYTAITRAREELYIICEPDRPGKRGTLWKAAKSPRIKGDTLAEKAEYFKGKQEEYNNKYAPLEDGVSGKRVYKETPKESKSVPVIPPSPPVKLVKMEEFVSDAFRRKAELSLDSFWIKARGIWGDKIGQRPSLRYNLQRGSTVGLARLGSGEVMLNPIWCILADENETIAAEMLVETIGHEVAHFVAYNYSKDRGHDSGWRMAMKLLGLVPSVTADSLPPFATAFQYLAEKKRRELAETKNADVKDDYISNSYDEV